MSLKDCLHDKQVIETYDSYRNCLMCDTWWTPDGKVMTGRKEETKKKKKDKFVRYTNDED
jgi:hypothetical protein